MKSLLIKFAETNVCRPMSESNIIPDCLFPTDNELEIPMLRLDIQPTCVAIPFVCFGEQKRTFKMNGTGTLHFYTDDYRFNSIYDHPEKILAHDPMNIVEPNWNLFNETPIAFGLQAIYKKRWLARAMQERGVGVFVDLNVANKFARANLIGVPKGYSSFCTRGYEDRINALEFEYMIALRVASGNPLTFVVYGGGELVKQWCRENGCIYVTPIITIKNRQKAIAKMQSNAAQLGDGRLFDVQALLPESGVVSDFKEQVLDFSPSKPTICITE